MFGNLFIISRRQILKTNLNEAFQALGVSKTIPHGTKLLGAYFKAYFDWKIIGQLPE